MMISHIMLGAGWILYCVLHSVFASVKVKQVLQRKMRRSFRYYRFAYTLFAFFGLGIILFYQFSIRTIFLFASPLWLKIAGGVLMTGGAVIMLLMIWKYFMQLSGVRWLFKEEVSARLEITGLHNYVRHPLYLGTFAFIWGWFLIRPYISYFIACAIITIYTLVALIFEEEKLVLEFGDDYVEYKKNVPKIIPKLKSRTHADLKYDLRDL